MYAVYEIYGLCFRLDVRQGEHGNHVPGLTQVPVENLQNVFDLLAVADRNRSQTATNMNEHSSRSHMMLTVNVVTENLVNGQITRGKLNLVRFISRYCTITLESPSYLPPLPPATPASSPLISRWIWQDPSASISPGLLVKPSRKLRTSTSLSLLWVMSSPHELPSKRMCRSATPR